MRTLITTIIVWAILLGFFAGGVSVMATSPSITDRAVASDSQGDSQTANYPINPNARHIEAAGANTGDVTQ